MTPDSWCGATRHEASNAAYVNGCRCTPARAAAAAYERARYADRLAGRTRLIDGTGTRRRLQALCAAGWPSRLLAERLYVDRSAVEHWRNQPTISRVNAAKISSLYDEIGVDEGPSSISKASGRRNRWPTPIEWGLDIDDPAAKPLNLDRVFVEGDPRRAVPMEDVEMIALSNETWASASARLGTNRAALERRLYRAKRKDLVDRFYRNSEFYNTPLGDRRWTA